MNAGARPDPGGETAATIERLHSKLDSLPRDPGVYLMKGACGEVLYAGKARDLRARVRGYFAPSPGDTRPHIRLLVPKVADVEVVVTSNEKEALLLEDTLIKKHRPRYNVRLRDDKTYVSLKITVQERFPRILVERRPRRDGSLVFGPYSSARAVRETIKHIRTIFPLRTCSNRQMENRTRPCLDCQIHHCLAPCVGPADEEGYRQAVEGAVMFLRGRSRELVETLARRMRVAAEAERFEEAARIRDRILAIETTLERQRVHTQSDVDQDVVGFVKEGEKAQIALLTVRRGVLTGSQSHPLPRVGIPDEEAFGSWVKQTYAGREDLPDEILLSVEIEDSDVLSEVLTERKGGRVAVLAPQRGEKRRLIELACENARASLSTRAGQGEGTARALEEIRRKLGLPAPPGRIECFDISNTQGRLAVGSMVVFAGGEPAKDSYRRYRIRTKDAPDDYAMMREVLDRRFRRAREEGDAPDMILVDGGKGQLGVATAVLDELGIEGVAAAGIAKGEGPGAAARPRGSGAEVRGPSDRVFVPGRKGPVGFRASAPGLRLLQRVRDEAHRFAIAYHRRLREKAALASVIEAVPGVGPARRRSLITRFGGVEGLRAASAEEIASVGGVPAEVARAVYAALRPAGAGEARGAVS